MKAMSMGESSPMCNMASKAGEDGAGQKVTAGGWGSNDDEQKAER